MKFSKIFHKIVFMLQQRSPNKTKMEIGSGWLGLNGCGMQAKEIGGVNLFKWNTPLLIHNTIFAIYFCDAIGSINKFPMSRSNWREWLKASPNISISQLHTDEFLLCCIQQKLDKYRENIMIPYLFHWPASTYTVHATAFRLSSSFFSETKSATKLKSFE